VLALARNEGRRHGRWIGVYPELKDPTDYARAGLDMTQVLIDCLAARDMRGPDAIVWVQCFESAPLVRVKQALALPCFELFEQEKCAAPAFFDGLAARDPKVLDGIAVDKRALDDGFMRRARELGYKVHAWTYRDDALPTGVAHPKDEYATPFALGVDALFSDFPSTALAARRAFTPA
jgi:glycerophosphoryl diester phosphodiesterase